MRDQGIYKHDTVHVLMRVIKIRKHAAAHVIKHDGPKYLRINRIAHEIQIKIFFQQSQR